MIANHLKFMSFQDILTLPTEPKLIAFTGYGHAGKDAAAKPLIDHGYTRRCFGDVIKKQCKELIQNEMGLDSFTEDPVEKHTLRPILETWGEVNYDNISNEFYENLPEYCVNTRISRTPEVIRWIERGGIIVAIDRPGVVAQTQWEERIINDQLAHESVPLIIVNDSSVQKLHEVMMGLFLLNHGRNTWSKISGDRPRLVRCSRGLASIEQLDGPPSSL